MSWSAWKPSKEMPWDARRATHLWRRAGFAPDWATIQQSLKEGVEATLDRILEPPADSYASFDDLATTIGEAAVGADSSDRLRAWWIYRMMFTPYPLEERLTLMWHNHFATSNDKVQNVSLMYGQNTRLRKHCLDDFGVLLKQVVKHPAMLIWLDADSNRKEHPNENLARELLELFTLGEGNYNEADIPEAARCLTGWTVSNYQFAQIEKFHDPGEKRLLGRADVSDGNQLLDALVKQPATARRVVWRLCQEFFADSTLGNEKWQNEAMVELANEAQQHQLSTKWIVRKILASEYFFADANIRSKIPSPAQYIVGPIRALEMQRKPPSTLILAEQFRIQGQDLFHPPNVFGWNGGRDWINTRSILARRRFAQQLLEGNMHQVAREYDVLQLPKRYETEFNSPVSFYNQLLLSGGENERLKSTGSDELREQIIQMISDPITQLV